MLAFTIDSVRISLMSQHRVIVLKEVDRERYLAIWIGACEAESITVKLQGLELARPLTHDILLTTIQTLGASVIRVEIYSLREDVFYARLVLDRNGGMIFIDARPSDAIAVAARAGVPILVANAVADEAALLPEKDIRTDQEPELPPPPPDSEENLSAFSDFLETLDWDDSADS